MTTYVIDSRSPLPPTYGQGEHALRISDNDTVILSRDALIAAYGVAADGIQGGFNTHVTIDGGVIGNRAIALHGIVDITATGVVQGRYSGVDLRPSDTSKPPSMVMNAGLISVSGGWAGIAVSDTSAVIYNSGTISGPEGINATSYNAIPKTLTINNSGTIKGFTSSIVAAYTNNTIINTGTIDGKVTLSIRNDYYDGRSGTLNGSLQLSDGDDVALCGSQDDEIYIGSGTKFIDGGAGIDTIHFGRQVFVDLRVTDEQKTSDTSWDTIRNVENLIGSPLADRLYGSDDANILDGAGGNDLLEGNDGDDLLIGDAGGDSISGGAGVDVSKYSGNFADYTIRKQADGSYAILDTRTGLNDGSDVLIGIEYAQFADRTIALTSTSNSAPTSVSLDTTSVDASAKPGALVGHLSGVDPDGDALGYFLASNPGGHFRIQGDQLLVEKAFAHGDTTFDVVVRASDPKGASLDEHFTIKVVNGSVSVVPKGQVSDPAQSAVDPSRPEEVAPSLSLGGSKKADRLVGGAGDDRLDGKLGADKLTGAAGDDVFAFTTKLGKGNVDRILDFKAGDDTIQLSGKIFAKIGKGHLDKGEFRLGTKALDEDDRIIYDRKSGNLFYDKDGSGTAYGAVKFAQVKAKADLSAHDFLIV